MTATSPNFVLLDSTRPDIANLVVAMLQTRDAVGRVSPHRVAAGSARNGIAAACTTSSRSRAHVSSFEWHGRDGGVREGLAKGINRRRLATSQRSRRLSAFGAQTGH
jgi:hypothetical protein